MKKFRWISSATLWWVLVGPAASQEAVPDAPSSDVAVVDCSMDFSIVAAAIEQGDVDGAQEALARLAPSLPQALVADDAEECRTVFDQLIELAKLQRFTTTEDTVLPLSETGHKALVAARELFRQGDIVPMGNVLASAGIAEPDLAATPQFQLLQGDLDAATEAARLLDDDRFDAALRELASIVVADPLNPWARATLARAKLGFVAEFPDRVLQQNPSLSLALLMAPRELAARDQIRAAWHELESIPFGESDPDVAVVREEIVGRAETKAREAIGYILAGYREEWIPSLEDAAAALDERASIHLYLALAYYGQYLETLETNPDLLQRAQKAIVTALAIDPGVVPPRKYFTPQLLEVIEDVRIMHDLAPPLEVRSP